MARVSASTRKLLAGLVAPVVKAHGGPPKVAEKVGRDRTTVYRWTKGDIDLDGLASLASGLRTDLVLTFPAHGSPKATQKEPPPDWARAMSQKIDAIQLAVTVGVIESLAPEELRSWQARIAEILDAFPTQSDEASGDPPDTAAQGGAGLGAPTPE